MSAPAAPSRFVSWGDSQALRSALECQSGLEVLRAVAEGALPLPPIAALLDAEIARVEHGEVEVFAHLGEVHRGFYAGVEPALVTAVLEFTAGAVIATLAPAGAEVALVRFAVQHVKAVASGSGPLRCSATATRLDDGVVEAWVSADALRTGARAGEGSAVALVR